VKPLLPVLVAGGAFAAAATIGLLVGIVAAGRIGEPLLAPAGLLLGAAVGAYSAVRLLLAALR
jgi:hypothetical protein